MISVRDAVVFLLLILALIGLSRPKALLKFIPKSLPKRGGSKKKLKKKYNPVILSKTDYDTIRTSRNYWQCLYCDAIVYGTHSKCKNCGAPRKEKPRRA